MFVLNVVFQYIIVLGIIIGIMKYMESEIVYIVGSILILILFIFMKPISNIMRKYTVCE